jgi:secondary thiamine-phosphate synthase enzyme
VQQELSFSTQPRSFINITKEISALIAKSDIDTGLCNLFLKHTSASIILCENADPDVLYDLENYMQRLVQDDHPEFRHTAEGSDDMSAHIRSVLTSNSLTIPVTQGRLNLGTWQGIFLWEHRAHQFNRKLVVSVI